MHPALNHSRFTRFVFVPALFAITALNACQKTAVPVEVCIVTPADIEGLQSKFRARVNAVAQELPNAHSLDASPLPNLEKPFQPTVRESLIVTADDPKAPVNYRWRVGLEKGCSLEARLGTNTEAAPEGAKALNVKALSLKATKATDGALNYAPIALVLNK